jgi:hypothetical protein
MLGLRLPRRTRGTICLALVALLAQLALPGLHMCLASEHAAEVHARHAAEPSLVTGPQGAPHDPLTCPICQALAADHATPVARPVRLAACEDVMGQARAVPHTRPARRPDLTTESPRGPPARRTR